MQIKKRAKSSNSKKDVKRKKKFKVPKMSIGNDFSKWLYVHIDKKFGEKFGNKDITYEDIDTQNIIIKCLLGSLVFYFLGITMFFILLCFWSGFKVYDTRITISKYGENLETEEIKKLIYTGKIYSVILVVLVISIVILLFKQLKNL